MIGHDPNHTYRAAVIGAGSGGLTLAIGLAGLGHDVVMIESGKIGGDCTNVGCIPSKALLSAAAEGHENPLARARARRDHLFDEEVELIEKHPSIHLVRGWASLTDRRDPHVVEVAMTSGDIVDVRAEHVIVASGSQPAEVSIDGVDPSIVVTNEEVFDLARPPASLAIIGGGSIAIEMATAFAALSTKVDVVELQPRLLPAEDPLITDVVESALRQAGVSLHLGVGVDRADPGTGSLRLSDGSKIDAPEVILLAVGRRPRVEGLGLQQAGVAHSPRGIVADDWGRTSVPGIWAVGDVTGNTLTTHGANAVGRRAVRAIGLPQLPKITRRRAMPMAIYGRPEVASVGLSLDELDAWGSVGRRRIVVDYSDVDRGFTDGIEHGRLVLDVERFNGKILRASIVGPSAGDLIGMFTMAIDNGLGLRKLFPMIHPYPSHAEILREAADQFAAATLNDLPGELTKSMRGRLGRLVRRRR